MVSFQASDEYRLEQPILFGPCCSRYRAVRANGDPVEIVVISDRMRSASGWAQLCRQIRLAAQCRTTGVRRIPDFQLDRDPCFVVYAICPESLDQRQRIQPLSDVEILQLASVLIGALSEAHRLGCVVGTLNADRVVIETGDWVMDISGLDTVADFDSESAAVENPKAADVVSLAQLLRSLSARSSVTDPVYRDRLEQILEGVSDTERQDIPDAHQLALRVQQLLPMQNVKSMSDDHQNSDGRSSDIEPLSISAGYDRTIVPDSSPVNADVFFPNVDGQRLGRFQLQEKIGEGASGIVYRAIDSSSDVVVAVKILNPLGAGNEATVRRFEKEAKLLAQVNNACVAGLLEFNTDRGVSFLAVEYLSGGTLAKALRQIDCFDENTAVRFLRDVSRGLAVAHELGIVHRDIKPENMLLTEAGAQLVRVLADETADSESGDVLADEPLVKLSDFGLARAEHQTDSMAITHFGSIMGTPLYMSPEQCRGESVDSRTDVYAMGATLFHLLVGRPPFEGETNIAVINKQCHEAPPPLRVLKPELSDAVAQIVDRCLCKNPDARYGDAELLCRDLGRLLHGEPTSLMLHPATPQTGCDDVMEFRFSCEVRSTAAALWPYVSNTDRVNHSLGLSTVSYTNRIHPERGSERFAETRIAGQRLVWQEHPYEWMEGRRMSVLREFSAGPFHWFVNVVELQPLPGGGTRILQSLRASPKNWLGRIIARYQLGRRTPPAFSRVYHQIDEYLIQDAQRRAKKDAFGKASAMTRSGKQLLASRLERLRSAALDPVVLETLGQFLQHGADQEVARIRPIAFAERFGLDPQQVITACLLGAREGLLVLLWDILCPSCQIPADVQDTLENLKQHSYCPACDLRYELDFANSVELIFRAHPELRNVETRTYCIGGPAFSAHVAAQVRLAPDERFVMEMSLTEGDYRLRGPQLPFSVNLRVSQVSRIGHYELSLRRPPNPESVPVLRSGAQVLTLTNDSGRELQIRLERTVGRQSALTAASASTLPLFRELFPEQVLSPGQIVGIANVTLLLADLPDAENLYLKLGDGPAFGMIRDRLLQLDTVVRQYGGAVVKIVGEGMLSVFTDPEAAVRTACAMLEASPEESENRFRLAVHRGPALVTTLNDRLDYFGETVLILRRLQATGTAGELMLTPDVADQSNVSDILNRLVVRMTPVEMSESDRIVCRCRMPAPAGFT